MAGRRERAEAFAQRWRGRAEGWPIIGTLITEWYRIEVIDRSMAIAAQGLLAILPMLVVLAAFLPHDVAQPLYEQVRATVGLQSDQAQPLGNVLVDEHQVSANTGLIGLLVVLASATSFSRALQRMYARAFDLDWDRRRGKIRASAIWLVAWLAFMGFLAWFGRHSSALPLGTALFVGLVLHLGFWWWTLHTLLLGDCPWSDLFPTALLSTVALGLVVRGSRLVMPVYARGAIDQYGAFGLILALASWMVVSAGALVLCATAGSLVAQTSWWRRLAERLGLPGATI